MEGVACSCWSSYCSCENKQMCFGACEQAHRQGKGSEFVAGVPIAPKIPIF